MSISDDRDGVAVVGMACVFPGAPDLVSYWRNIRDGVDAIADVPEARWDPVYFDPASDAVDRFYCHRGGFVDGLLDFDALGFGIMPVAARGAEPDQLAALQVASRALQDAGYGQGERDLPRDRTGVVLGRGNYIGAGMTRLEQHVRTAQQLVTALRGLVPGISETQLAAVKAEFQQQLGGYGPDTAIGLVPNLTASRIANRLDLGGPAYTLDAACASTLIAVERASSDLRSGRLDLALAGGVHLSHDVAFWSVFTQLGALSRAQQIRPFDRRADGLLIGEGLGVVVLKRQAEAERDGDRIYAVLRGEGVASDGRSATIMTPSLSGQRLALERAWAGSGLDPASIGLVEAHGTATPVGDAAEVSTLRDFFGPLEQGQQRAALGSVKSMIGHTMPAAGAAGLIKAVLAVYHGVLPPSLHCEQPLPELERTRFAVQQEAAEWTGTGPRRAAVNAFGFGGINAHLVLESHGPPPRRRRRGLPESDELLWLARPDLDALLQALDEGAASGGSGPCRLALVDPSTKRRARARTVVAKGRPRRGRDGLWFSPRGLLASGGKLAFLFPGVEAQVPGRLPDVAGMLGRSLPPPVAGTPLELHGATVVENGRLLADALSALGANPDLVAGHSTGEWTGMMAAGLIPPDRVDGFLATLTPGSLEVPGVLFLSVAAGVDRVQQILGDALDGRELVLTHDNCPHQVVLCGREDAVEAARDSLVEARVIAHVLPFRSGFHAPFLEPYLAEHLQRLATMPLAPARQPLWSATTAAPYPDDLQAVRSLAARHLVEPVRFRQLSDALYADGVRVFVQLGLGSLVGFVSDTLRGQEHLAISAQEPQRSGLAQLRRVAAALFVEGLDLDLQRLAPAPTAVRSALSLDLGVPLVQLQEPLKLGAAPVVPAGDDPLSQRFAALGQEIQASLGQVQAALGSRRRGAPPRQPLPPPQAASWTMRLGVDDQPYLEDHSLIPQRPGWPVLADRNPVVPMTMSVRLLAEAAERVAPGRVAVGLEQVRAHRWMAVEPPVQVRFHAEPRDSEIPGEDRVHVQIEGYVEATVRLARRYPVPPTPSGEALAEERSVGVSAQELYAQRWMFHGPRYHAVSRLDALADDGIRGGLVATEAKGALLDGAGQLLGLWVMRVADKDRLAMPVKIEAIDFFGPEPAPGRQLDCTVWLRRLTSHEVRADLELVQDGALHARIRGWTDWRFETDERLWPVMQQTEHHLFAEPCSGGLVVVQDPGRSSSSRDYLARRFLSAAERAQLASLPRESADAWLYSRIAIRDAVRRWLQEQGGAALFPVELELSLVGGGQATVQPPEGSALRVAYAARGSLAAAVVGESERCGVAIRGLPADGDADAVESARLDAATLALLRARGTRLAGGARPVLSESHHERLRLDGVWVDTQRRSDAIIAWICL